MSKIIEFNSKKDYYNYVNQEAVSVVGKGSEGVTFLTKDDKVIKVMIYSWMPKKYKEYPDIIMEDDIKLDSFIFPKELYIINGIIVGYKEDYFKDNVFGFDSSLDRIDIDKIIKAREKFIEDTKVITDKGYKLYELPRNLMFNNNKFVAIDTLDYIKDNKVTLDINKSILDYAILLELSELCCDVDSKGSFEEEMPKVYSFKNRYYM